MNQQEVTTRIAYLESKLSLAKDFIKDKCTCKLWNKDHPDYGHCRACLVMATIEPKREIDSYCGAV